MKFRIKDPMYSIDGAFGYCRTNNTISGWSTFSRREIVRIERKSYLGKVVRGMKHMYPYL